MISRTVSSTIIMRIDSTRKIDNLLSNKTLQFSCAANWLDYALKKKDFAIGDPFECVFARLPMDDPRIYSITDTHGKPMGDHLLTFKRPAEGVEYLRFIPTILMPVLCFYSFDVYSVYEQLNASGNTTKSFAFNLDKYREDMRYSEDEASFLFIHDTARFFAELKESIPLAVASNKDNLTSKRFYGRFDPDQPMLISNIDYHKHTRSEIYYHRTDSCEEIFWKYPEYEHQSELRIVIPNLNYDQTYDPNTKYDYRKNTLDVFLPHFDEYAKQFPAKGIHSLVFQGISKEGVERFIVSKEKI